MGLFSRKRSAKAERAEDVDEGVDDDTDDGAAPDDDDAAPEEPVEDTTDHGEDEDEDEETVETSDDELADDDAPSDDEDELVDDEDDELVDTGQIEFELADWGARERQLLDAELAAVRVRRAWEASTLVVAASDADVVDDLIDLIEERIALDLPLGTETVLYGVGDWPDGLEDRFIEALIDARIAHRRDYREVAVGVDDEERVDALVETVTEAWEEEQPDPDELDGPDAQDVLSELFVSSDRLLHDPSDKSATIRFDDASTLALDMRLPFGFDEAGWGAITDLTATLRDRLGDTEATNDEIVEAATNLRTHLRPLV